MCIRDRCKSHPQRKHAEIADKICHSEPPHCFHLQERDPAKPECKDCLVGTAGGQMRSRSGESTCRRSHRPCPRPVSYTHLKRPTLYNIITNHISGLSNNLMEAIRTWEAEQVDYIPSNIMMAGVSGSISQYPNYTSVLREIRCV